MTDPPALTLFHHIRGNQLIKQYLNDSKHSFKPAFRFLLVDFCIVSFFFQTSEFSRSFVYKKKHFALLIMNSKYIKAYY
ncbi:hypothetical protein DICVIV_00228 [Dictyocaulus viviparus]|uniref:Uncharacterized protein n=1 Tax=Dictyocaulus viviparus TaxID=29172 RepID=A0A0D8Y9Q6_DICVI|nr:hypothetical protein DICVIV_00228 [Dictyocaulus viviparus]